MIDGFQNMKFSNKHSFVITYEKPCILLKLALIIDADL